MESRVKSDGKQEREREKGKEKRKTQNMLQWESKAENVYSAQSGVTALLRTGQSENLKLWQIFWLHKYWQSFFFSPCFFILIFLSV